MTDPRDGITPTDCPACGYRLDAAQDADGNSRPASGDVSFCFGCGTILIFTDDMAVRLATDTELDELAKDDPELHRRVRVWAKRAAAFHQAERN